MSSSMSSQAVIQAFSSIHQKDDQAEGATPKTDTPQLPVNLEAEQALLGAILLNNNSFETISDFLKAEHFSQKIHQDIYQSIALCIERGYLANPVTIKDFLKQNEDFNALGGYQYLIDLTDITYQTSLVYDYGKLLYDLYLRRQLIGIGHDTMVESRVIDGEKNAIHLIEETERKLYYLATKGQDKKGAVSLKDALSQAITTAEAAYKRDSHVVGVTTGFLDLDLCLGGLHSSDLLILAGRPSMGKTALATNIAFNAARVFHEKSDEGSPVLFFSLEMSAEQLANRILSTESGISSDSIRRGSIRSDQFPQLIETSRVLSEIPLFIDDTPALSIMTVRNRARRLRRQHQIGLIVIDYLQLLSSDGHKRSDSRVQEISDITRGLKALAKELNVPVLALSQLSREVEKREDKKPQLSDLRESGSIEQDADVVMFVYREEYYLSRKEPAVGTPQYQEWMSKMTLVGNQAEVIIAKQRHGPIKNITLYFDSNLTKFGNLKSN